MTLVAEPGLVTAEAEPPPRRRGYASYVGRKVLGSIGSLIFMLLVNFFLFRVLPGRPGPQPRSRPDDDGRATGGLQQGLRA